MHVTLETDFLVSCDDIESIVHLPVIARICSLGLAWMYLYTHAAFDVTFQRWGLLTDIGKTKTLTVPTTVTNPGQGSAGGSHFHWYRLALNICKVSNTWGR